jgi:hypothetical protein
MTDTQLEVKFSDLIDGILPKAQSRELMGLCWNVEQLPAADLIARKAVASA